MTAGGHIEVESVDQRGEELTSYLLSLARDDPAKYAFDWFAGAEFIRSPEVTLRRRKRSDTSNSNTHLRNWILAEKKSRWRLGFDQPEGAEYEFGEDDDETRQSRNLINWFNPHMVHSLPMSIDLAYNSLIRLYDEDASITTIQHPLTRNELKAFGYSLIAADIGFLTYVFLAIPFVLLTGWYAIGPAMERICEVRCHLIQTFIHNSINSLAYFPIKDQVYADDGWCQCLWILV